MGEGNGIGTVIRGFVVFFMEKLQNFALRFCCANGLSGVSCALS